MAFVKKKLEQQWERKLKGIEEDKFATHVTVLFISFLTGLVIFLLTNAYLLPSKLPIPKTTAINWLVINQHSLTLDYIKFCLLALIILGSTIGGWILYVWKRKA